MGLLADGVGVHRLTVEPEAAQRVIELCGGLPLALDIVAARLATEPHWSISTLVALLEDRDRILAELHHNNLDVRPALDCGYHALPPKLRALLRKIGYYGNAEIFAWGASHLEGIPLTEAKGRLEALDEVQLVTVSRIGSSGLLKYRCNGMVLARARERALTEDQAAELDAAVKRVKWAKYLALGSKTTMGM
jgi:hypothetical protein